MSGSSSRRSTQGHSVQISKNSRYGGGFGSSQQRSASSRSFSPQPGARIKGNAANGRGGQRGGYSPSPMQQGRGQMPSMGSAGYRQGYGAGRGGFGSGRDGGQYGNQYVPRGGGYDYRQDQSGRSQKKVAPQKGMYKKPRVPFIVKLLIFFVVLALIGGVIAYTFVNSDSYRIKQISVEGCEHLTNQEMSELAGVPENSTLLNINEAAIVNNLKRNPWVEDAHIERGFPDTLKLVVKERTVTAVCDVVVDDSETVETWALASDGMWLMKIPAIGSEGSATVASKIYDDEEHVLRIQGVPYGTSPIAGEICTNANISNALGIIDGMTTDLANQVKRVTASSSDSTTLTLKNGVEIAFGDSSDIRDKERVCLELMEKYPGQITYINVRVVNKPVWRSF